MILWWFVRGAAIGLWAWVLIFLILYAFGRPPQ